MMNVTTLAPRHRVLMVTYGESVASLPPMFHEGAALAAAGFEVESLHIAPASGSDGVDTNVPGFTSRRFRLRARNLFHGLFGRATANRGVAALQYASTYAEYVGKAFLLALRFRADVYEAHDLPALLPTVLAAKMRGKPIIYRAHELFSETHAVVRFARFWRLLDRALVPLCDEVVTPDDFRSRIYHEEFRAKRLPLTVRNCPPYRPPIESTRLRDELERRGIAFSTVVLYQGLIDSMRCIEEIAEATRHFGEGVILVVLGSGFGKWADPAAALAPYERIVVLPRVPYEELPAFTASADIGILLYRNDCRNNYYCAPNKVFEYMMMGLPVIAPSFPGMVGLVEGEQLGSCVDPERPMEIAAAVNRMAGDREGRARMRERGLRLSIELYNWEHESRLLLELIRSLCARDASRDAGGAHGAGAGEGSDRRSQAVQEGVGGDAR